MDYKKMYFTLFEASTKAIELLQQAQQEAENIYIEQKEAPVIKIASKEDKL